MAKSTDWRLFFADFVSLRSHEYVLWIGDDSLLFLRMCRSQPCETLIAMNLCHDNEHDIGRFFSQIRQLPQYTGQPIRVIVSSASAFTYARQLRSGVSSSLQHAVSALKRNDHTIDQSTIDVGARRFIVIRSIEKDLLAAVVRESTANGIPLLGISSVGSCLLCHNGGHERQRLVLADGSLWEYWCRPSGHVVCTRVGSEAPLSAGHGSDTPTSEIDIKECSSYLIPSFKTASCFHKLSFKTAATKTGRIYATAANALRLLSTIMFVLLIMVLSITLVTSEIADTETTRLDTYQQAYTDYLALEQRVGRIKSDIEKAERSLPHCPPLANGISLFCQKSYPGLYLSSLNLSVDHEGVTINAEGNSLTEGSVFGYTADVRESTSWIVTTSQIQPVTERRGIKDGNQGVTFRIDVTSVHEE